MAVQVLIPERKSFMDKISGAFGQVAQGAQGVSSIKGLFGGGGAGGGAGVGGGAAGGMGLGVGNVTPVTSGMSPTLGGEAAAGGGGVAPATSTSIMGSTIVGPAAGVAGGYYAQTKLGEAMERKRDVPNAIAKEQIRNNPAMAGTKFEDNYVQSGSAPEGLSLTSGNPNKLGAMERRYSNQQTAMQDIQAAQKELVNSGIPEQERVRIGQKLEIARQQMEGRSRGPRSTYS